MPMLRVTLLAAGLLTLAACSGGSDEFTQGGTGTTTGATTGGNTTGGTTTGGGTAGGSTTGGGTTGGSTTGGTTTGGSTGGTPELDTIVVTPSPVTLNVGQTQPFTATGVYSDASQRDITTEVSWTSTAPTVASVTPSGLAVALAPGQTQIRAAQGEVQGAAQLEVKQPEEPVLPFKVGAAETPASFLPIPGSVCLGGYDLFCERDALAEHDPLTVGAVAISGANDETFLLVKTTNVGYFAAYKAANGPNGLYDIRQRIARRLEELRGSVVVPADRIVVTSDHSHQGPDTIGIWGGVSPMYMALLAQAAVDAGVQAWQNRRPARLYAGSVQGPPTAGSYNRAPTNHPDREFRVLFAEDREGGRIATLMNYAPHATVLSSDNVSATGDWTAWAAQEASLSAGGIGIGLVGALGAMDWNKTGDDPEREAEARQRLIDMLAAARAARSEVDGDTVAVRTVFIREPLAQPVLIANYAPRVPINSSSLSIERAETPPWSTVSTIGTYAVAVRLGDVFIGTMPGEPFPQLHYALRPCDTLPEGAEGSECGGITNTRMNFLLGAANDFLGYMLYTPEQYRQSFEEGALYLGNCPEEELQSGLGQDYDGACPDHWTLMVSPTIGRHLVCTLQDAAAELGFALGAKNAECPLLTAFDNLAAPAEYPAIYPVSATQSDLLRNPGAGVAANCRAQGGPAELCDGLEAVGDTVGAQLADALAAQPLPPVPVNPSKAGVATRDASWHLGASAGQFSASGAGIARDAGFDPYGHSVRKVGADILGTRINTRALVVEDGDGNRVAIAANDLYLPNDLLHRRVAQRLVEHDALVRAGLKSGPITRITDANLATTSSHSHTSPFYSTPGWGTWIFQDVFDLRFYEYMATQMSEAVIDAVAGLKPTRMGGASIPFNAIQAHTYGPKTDAENGTPAGQPYDYTTQQLTLLRFDDMSDPAAPKPLANWIVFGVHPEWVWGEEIVNGDVTHAAMRMLDRELGAVTVMSQMETGASGPHKDTRVHEPEARREFQESALAGADRGARLLADTVKQAYAQIAQSDSTGLLQFAPMRERFRVAHASNRFAPPATRPYPGISNCNTDPFWDGHVGLPILGFPDCFYDHTEVTDVLVEPFLGALPFDPRQLKEQLEAAGVPIPSSYSATSFTAVEETAAVHLQVFKLGDVVAAMCPCELFTSQALNLISRLDRKPDNLWHGYDWICQLPPEHPARAEESAQVTAHCERQGTRFPDSRGMRGSVEDLEAVRRIRAQIHNDAAHWELDPVHGLQNQDPSGVQSLGGEAEAADPADIKGNFSHEEFTLNGYDLVIPVGMVNDYWGYMPEYREYRSHDHYRKALNGLGPHGADFIATRLARMAAKLNGAQATLPFNPLDAAYQAESGRANALAQTLGELARAYTAIYEAQLPADGGSPAITQQPQPIVPRFSAAVVKFVGGSNYADMPLVRVERLVSGTVEDGVWEGWGTQEGEVQLQLAFLPSLISQGGEIPLVGEGAGVVLPDPQAMLMWRAGLFEWVWTASFEAFLSEVPDLGARPGITPEGQYRFVIDGTRRTATGVEPYHLVSGSFTVVPWNGITVEDVRVESDGRVSFVIGPVNEVRRFKSGAGEGDIVIPDTEPPYVVGPIDYPDSYSGGLTWIRNERQLFRYGDGRADDQQYCGRCTFRPWADTAEVARAEITVERADGSTYTIEAQRDGARWISSAPIDSGERAFVAAGGIVDQYGERNAVASRDVTR